MSGLARRVPDDLRTKADVALEMVDEARYLLALLRHPDREFPVDLGWPEIGYSMEAVDALLARFEQVP